MGALAAHLEGGVEGKVPHAARVLVLGEAHGDAGGAPGLGGSDVPDQVAGKAVLQGHRGQRHSHYAIDTSAKRTTFC